MKKTIFLIYFLCFVITSNQAQTEIIPIIESNLVSVTFEFDPSPNLSIKDWLSLTLKNESDKKLTIKTFNYSINTFDESSPNEEITIREGALGRSKKLNLLSQFHNVTQPKEIHKTFSLNPGESIRSWKYISNTASATLEQLISDKKEECALMQVKIEMSDDGKFFEEYEGEEVFCFEWSNSKNVKTKLLKSHLEEKILDITQRRINSAIINTLSLNEDVAKKIDSDLIIKGIINRAYTENHAERLALLKILNTRKEQSASLLIDHYKACMYDPKCNWERDLEYYWNNELFDTLVANKLFINKKLKILELHAPAWETIETKEKLLTLILNHTQFDFNQESNQDNFLKWYKDVKLLSSSRHPSVIDYLIKLLDNETYLKIEDWSGQRNKKITTKKDLIKKINIRVCDVAFVGLLRAFNQVKVEKEFNGFKLSQKLFIDNKWRGVNLVNPDGLRLKNA
ncbi:MAG: hypothetical protein KJN84_06820, partial [Bacteroidia bacterium]|nr:hypothetical protein [Bacteroidia bacterium]